jgi:periplasmic protein TonB
MPLRCLLFSSNEEMVQPISQILTELGIEGEYCKNAVDAVERVTTQLFQIVITDWGDQPEATFLLKTARDLKAAQRPLTLAIVADDARPQALQAGANSVLLKPIRAEQVRDTLATACELLRAKLQPNVATTPRAVTETSAMAAAASAGATSVPVSVTYAPEKIRAGEFLQSPSSAPGGHFDTEKEVHESIEGPVTEVDALSELEPTAAAVEEIPELKPEPQEPLSGWAALQARLTKSTPEVSADTATDSEFPSKKDALSDGAVPVTAKTEEVKASVSRQAKADSQSEAALFAYMSGESKSSDAAEAPAPKRGKVFLVCALAVAGVVLAVPRSRQTLQLVFHNTAHAGVRWLNPPPTALPQAVALHDSFGQSGDEYKLPAAGNIPDATTDASQIRVVPVIDPTAKPDKSAGANGEQTQTATVENAGTDQPKADQLQPPTDLSQPVPAQSPHGQALESQTANPTVSGAGSTTEASPAPPTVASTSAPPHSTAPPVQTATPLVRVPTQPPAASAGGSVAIPSSLKSQLASSTPEASGTKPSDAAMSSIEPVSLPEAAALELLAQPVDPEYPASAKASGQRGSVVLQVLIARDGTVQDAKFLQGSLIFARAAIDAVKQWRFKPYSMNGRAVSVQTVMTLNFKPPA